MKQVIYNGIEKVELREVPIPEIDDNGVLLKNKCAAICGTDVAAYFHGGDFARIMPGCEFGHEMVSEVAAVGKNVSDVKVGDRLYPFPIMVKADPSRSGTVGGYSEYIAAPSFRLNLSAFKVDDSISDEEASLIEPLTVGHHAAKLTEPSPEKNAIVFGAGMVGMASAIGLKHQGMKNVIIADLSELRLNIAKAMGFDVCDISKNDLLSYARDKFGDARGKANVDTFIDAAGVSSNIDLFMDNAKFGATLCIPAVYHKHVEFDLMKLTYGQFRIIGSPAYDMQDVQSVLEMLKNKEFDVAKLITQKYRLDNIEEALAMAADSKNSLKVIIDYR